MRQCARECSPEVELAAQLAEQPEALGDDVVLVDRLEVLLARGDERVVGQLREAARRRRGSSRARSPRRSAAGGGPSRPRRPRRSASSARRSPSDIESSTMREQPLGVDVGRRSSPGSRCAACRGRAGCASRRGRRRRSARSRSSEKPSAASRSRDAAWTSVCAHGQAVMPWAVTPISRRVPRRAGHGGAEQRVDLLREDARHRRRLVLGVARLDVHLGAAGALAVADLLGDVLRQRLGAEARLAEDDLADRVVDDLLEARHVRALLARAEVDEAVEAARRRAARCRCARMRMTFSTSVTPTRESDTWSVGSLALDVFEGES